MSYNDKIELRSEKVRSIIGEVPSHITRNGINIMGLILLILTLAAFYTPYSENIEVQVVVTRCAEHNIEGIVYIPYKYISSVRDGMTVQAEFEGYSAYSYGYIKGIVKKLDNRVVVRNNKNYFQAGILMDNADNTSYNLQKNMSGKASILLSEQSIVKYIFLKK